MTTVHFAGPVMNIENLIRQRCMWCGDVLIDHDLNHMLVAVVEQNGQPTPGAAGMIPTWEPGAFIATDGFATWVVQGNDPLPEDTCAASDLHPVQRPALN
jgi:hypothetical protein